MSIGVKYRHFQRTGFPDTRIIHNKKVLLRGTQEVYRPRRIKYSICYPVRGGKAPPPPIGVPPWPGLTGGEGTRGGVPPRPGSMGGYPPPGWLDLAGVPRPPCRCGLTKQSETITFPLVLRTRSVNNIEIFEYQRDTNQPTNEQFQKALWCKRSH